MDDSVIDNASKLVELLPQTWVGKAMIGLYVFGFVLGAVRYVLEKKLPVGPARAWIEAVDVLLQYVTASSKRLADRPAPPPKRKGRPPPQNDRWPPTGAAPAMCFALAFLAGCAGSLEQRTRTTLDTLALIVEPASQLAYDQCQREKQALADAHKPAEFEAAAERCARVVDAFDRIAVLQDAAATALEAGRVQQAQDMAKQVASLWRGMRGGQ